MTRSKLCLTLVAPEGTNLLNEPLINQHLAPLTNESEITWLCQGEAANITFTNEETTETLKSKINNSLADQPIDFALQPNENRRKKLLISDMDSTIIEEECIDEIAAMAGIKPQIAAITERAMRGEIEFEPALKERVALLKGLGTNALETVIQERLHLSKGARTLVQTMAANGAYCALVSGGFTFFTEKIAEKTGFHTTRANTLEIENNTLTGNVIPPILGSAAKRDALAQFISEKGLQAHETLAVGDGANDLEMIEQAGLGVAYKAKPIVAARAHVAINHTDLTSLLYFQGYKAKDFIQ